jgi:hypothetical protein
MHTHSGVVTLLASRATLLWVVIAAGCLCGCHGPIDEGVYLAAGGEKRAMEWGAPVKGLEIGALAFIEMPSDAGGSRAVGVMIGLRNRSRGPIKLLLPAGTMHPSQVDSPRALLSLRATAAGGGRSVYFVDRPDDVRQAVPMISGEVMWLEFDVDPADWPEDSAGGISRLELQARYRNADEQAMAMTQPGAKAVRVPWLWTGEVRSAGSRIRVEDSNGKPARAPASQPAP